MRTTRPLALPLVLLFSSFEVSLASYTVSSMPGRSGTGCDKALVIAIGGKEVYKLNSEAGLFYRTDLQVDADGSPRAYHPTNNNLALDYKANGYPWAIVFVNKKPYIQGPSDPAPGFYVSKTALEDKRKKEIDPGRYVNSEEIPYIVLPPAVIKRGKAKLGDLAVVINQKNGNSCYAIFADIGPKTKIGEGSVALAKALAINKSPKHGGAVADVIYVVFPGSGDGKPKSSDEINSKGAELFTAWGGTEQLKA